MTNKKRSLLGIIIALIAVVIAFTALIVTGGDDLDYVQIGVVAGGVVGILVAWLIIVVTKSNDNMKIEYDERQEAVRGRAFKYGFFTLIIYFALTIFIYSADFEIPAEYSVVGFLGIMLGVAVFVTCSIMNDAYYSLNENKKRVIIIFVVIAIVNIALAIMNFVNGECFTDGKLNSRCMNLICGIMFLYLFVVMGIKALKDKKEEEE